MYSDNVIAEHRLENLRQFNLRKIKELREIAVNGQDKVSIHQMLDHIGMLHQSIIETQEVLRP